MIRTILIATLFWACAAGAQVNVMETPYAHKLQAYVGKTIWYKAEAESCLTAISSRKGNASKTRFIPDKPEAIQITGIHFDLVYVFEVTSASGFAGEARASDVGLQLTREPGTRRGLYATCFFQRDPSQIESELRAKDTIGEFSIPLGMTPEERAQKIQDITGVDQTTAKAIRADNERAAKPGATIGMTMKQVREETSWGEPLKVNRTTLQGVEDEQWVYGGGQYLYFRNGRLFAIQN